MTDTADPALRRRLSDRTKRRAYLCAVFVGLPVDALGWLRLSEDPAIAASYGVTTVALVIIAVLTIWPMPLKRAERIAFSLLTVVFLLRLGVVLFLTPDLGAEIGEVITSLVVLSCVYLTAYLFLARIPALLMSIAVAVCSGGMIVAAIVVRAPDLPHGGMPLIKAFAMQGVLVSLLYVLAVTKEQMSASQARAQVLAELATTDALTGISNRRQLSEVLANRVAEVARSGRQLSVVLLDIDRFKDINDTHGHDVGDRVLRHLAATLAGEVRANDAFGRWGGEEFLIVAADSDTADAQRLAERCRQRLHEHPDPGVGVVTASFGVATLTPGTGWETLLRTADRLLYEAKESGRDQVIAEAVTESA